MRYDRIFVSTLLLLGAGACDWRKFDDIGSNAPIRAISRPNGSQVASFGKVITTYGYSYPASQSTGGVDEPRETRVAASGGGSSRVGVYRAWTGDSIALGGSTLEFCELDGECGGILRESLAGVRTDDNNSTTPGGRDYAHFCVAAGASDVMLASGGGNATELMNGIVIISCERGSRTDTRRITLANSRTFGNALASVPADSTVASEGGTPFELVIGEPPPSDTVNFGNLHLMARAQNGTPVMFDSSSLPTELASARGLGELIATASAGDGRFFIAAPMIRGTVKGVVIFYTYDRATKRSSDRDGTLRPVAWVPIDDRPGHGTSLAFANVVGDATPDLVIGDSAQEGSRQNAVFIYDGNAWGDPEALSDLHQGDVANWTRVDCPSVDGIACDGSGFGSSIAVGDINADGKNDIIVGAPNATVDGHAGAGAAYALPASDSGFGQATPAALYTSSPSDNGHLGAAVAVFESTPGRWEIVAGAPGVGAMYAFVCSMLSGDDPNVGPGCIPTAM